MPRTIKLNLTRPHDPELDREIERRVAANLAKAEQRRQDAPPRPSERKDKRSHATLGCL
jgi:hypothetical protein